MIQLLVNSATHGWLGLLQRSDDHWPLTKQSAHCAALLQGRYCQWSAHQNCGWNQFGRQWGKGDKSEKWGWSSWAVTPIRDFWRAHCPIRMILTKFVTKTVFSNFSHWRGPQSLQPRNSCFTRTKRMCQLIASDKSSEAPVHTFSRWRQTWAREPRAKHLSPVSCENSMCFMSCFSQTWYQCKVSPKQNNVQSYIQSSKPEIHHNIDNIIRLIYHTSITPHNDYRPNDSRLWPSRPIQLGTFGIRDLTQPTPKTQKSLSWVGIYTKC